MVHKGYTRGWSSRQHDSTCVYVNAGLTDVHAESNLDGSTNVECEGHVKRDSEATTVHGAWVSKNVGDRAVIGLNMVGSSLAIMAAGQPCEHSCH